MAYDTTEVSVSKSQEAIRKIIYSHKGTGLILISRPPHEGFEAFVEVDRTPYHVRIMATCKDVSRDRNGYIRTDKAHGNAKEQELRRVWRVLYWHIKAMFEAADSGVIDIRDVILPYVVLKDGMTLADHLQPHMNHCEDRPSRDIKPWNRWRWLSAHIVALHSASKIKIVEHKDERKEG